MKRYKYVVGGLSVKATPEEQQKTLDKMGDKGFELVAVVREEGPNAYIMFYFKKEIIDE